MERRTAYFSVRLLDFGTVRNTAVNFPVLHQAFLQNEKCRTLHFLQVCVKFWELEGIFTETIVKEASLVTYHGESERSD